MTNQKANKYAEIYYTCCCAEPAEFKRKVRSGHVGEKTLHY